MRFAILGCGGIAVKLAETVNKMSDIELYAVASRDKEKAEAFAEKYHATKAYGTYEEMLEDDNADLVYIALPHSHHCRWTKAAVNAGRNVLCEKAFAVNEAEAREMIELAEEKKVLLTEAIWTRYMPSRKIIKDLLDSKRIGEIVSISANLGYRINTHERIINPELAGGALLDLSVYPVNFASMILGNDIKNIHAVCIKTETGVDGQDNIMIEYNNGQMASLFTTIYGLTNRMGLIVGTEGFIEVENINNPKEIRVYSQDRSNPELLERIEVPKQISGYEYEVLACKKAIEQGDIQCPEMPHSETIEIMHQLDTIRKQFGITYPFE